MTNQVTKVTEKVTMTGDNDDISVTCSKDDPLFGDFVEKSEKGDENSVTVTKLSPFSSPTQTVGNEGLMKKGDKVTEISNPYTREKKMKNTAKELKNPVTSVTLSPMVIKKHKLDKDGNIILED